MCICTHTLPLIPYPFLCIISLRLKLPPASVLPSLNWFFRHSNPFTPLSLCCASTQCSLHMTNHLPCLYVISYHFRPCPLFCIFFPLPLSPPGCVALVKLKTNLPLLKTHANIPGVRWEGQRVSQSCLRVPNVSHKCLWAALSGVLNWWVVTRYYNNAKSK